MTTFVGTQAHFIDAMKSLVELEYDMVEAYQAAINRIESAEYKQKLQEFMDDHKRHISDLSALIRDHGDTPPTSPSTAKQWLVKGKVVIAGLVGDKTILAAMADNEKDSKKAYERMLEYQDQWQGAKEVLKKGLADENHHKDWFDRVS